MMLNDPAGSDASRTEQAAHSLLLARLKCGEEARLRIATASMVPMLRPGDWIVVSPHRAGKPRIGDILLVALGDAFLAHRLIRREKAREGMRFVTKGDDAPVADGPRNISQCAAVVVAVERGGRTLDLQSGRARWMALGIAFFSRAECAAPQRIPGPVGRLLARIARYSVSSIARAAQATLSKRLVRSGAHPSVLSVK